MRNLSQAADLFAASVEFRSATQGKSNGELVDFMHHNTLDRDPDAGGRAYWLDRLDHGTSRGELLLLFSQSAEHAALMVPHIVSGIGLF